jgi:glutamyl-tRNA reductase
MMEFDEWYEMRKHVPMLKDLKLKLKALYDHPQYVQHPKTTCSKTIDLHIQRVLNDTAGKIKAQNTRGCQYIAAINEFISAKN